MSSNPILTRVMVHDPNPFLADSICRGLETSGQFDVMASSRELCDALEAFGPDMLIVDPDRLEGPLDQWVAAVRGIRPRCDLIGYIAPGDRGAALRCLGAGFAGAIAQDKGIEVIVEALTAVSLGAIYVEQSLAPVAGEAVGRPEGAPETLSERERFVLEQVARGFSSKEIAQRLGLSPKTVETHRSRAAGKLGLRRKSEIVTFAIRNAWLNGTAQAL